ncbi:MAG: TetR/AcrR family transcriptional regulator [Chitinophagaceae bacterium]
MELRERILNKAEEVFLRYGIRSVSMDDLATQLGMSKKTLYQAFTEKDELILEIVKIYTERSRKDCESVRAISKDAIHENLLTMQRVMEDLSNMNPVVLYDLQKFHHKAYEAFLDYKNNYLLQFIQENLERGIQEKLFRDDFDKEIISRYRLESMMIPFNIGLFPPSQFNFVKTHQLITENFIYGLVTKEGFQLLEHYKQEIQKTN